MSAHDLAGVERVEATDLYRDYVLAPYEPASDPTSKLRSVNVFYRTLDAMGVGAQGRALVQQLRSGLGQGYTVWGVKHLRGELSWELYFYNPERTHPRIRIDEVSKLFGPVATIAVSPPRELEWHMFSISFGREELRRSEIDKIHVYVNDLDGRGASRSYAIGRDSIELENLYTFHDPRTEAHQILGRLRGSVHLDRQRTHLAAALWPELFRCRRICVANKPLADGMYFSGVSVAQLILLLRRQRWPASLLDYVEIERSMLDHIRWDVGFDFRTGAGSAGPCIEKSAFYATF